MSRWSVLAVVRPLPLVAAVTSGLLLGACSRAKSAAAPRAAATAVALDYLERRPVGAAITTPPWVAHVIAVDLDRDGLLDVVACEGRSSEVVWIRQVRRGEFAESTLAGGMRGPVRAEPADFDGDGDLDVLVASMGEIFPNNDRIGTVFILENDGRQRFTAHAVLEHTSRVTDVRAGDFNGDGRLDLALAQFGYDQGEVSWLERTGPWDFRRHVLLPLSGAVNVGVADFNGDGRPDIAALVSQQWEEVHYFENRGEGRFASNRIWGSTNEDYGSSGMTVCDLNRDGRPDLLYSNGDGFGPAAVPGPRPWHGVQWLENAGGGQFRFHRIGNLAGAYSPVAVDLDGDGHQDVVAVAGYADLSDRTKDVSSLQWFRNDGHLGFEPRVLARQPRDLITLTAGDFDGHGRPGLATGAFYVAPPYDSMDRISLWRRASP